MPTWKNAAALLAVAAIPFAAGQALPLAGQAAAQPPGKDRAAQPPREGAPAMPDMDAILAHGRPGEGHKVLEQLAGDWHGEIKFWMSPDSPPMTSTGTIRREWVLGGRFLREDVTGETPGMPGPFKGLGFMGYNNLEKRYETVWMENMATWMTTSTGTYDPETRTLTMTGEHIHPGTLKRMKTRAVVDLSKPGTEAMVGYAVGPDGKEFKNFEGHFERK